MDSRMYVRRAAWTSAVCTSFDAHTVPSLTQDYSQASPDVYLQCLQGMSKTRVPFSVAALADTAASKV